MGGDRVTLAAPPGQRGLVLRNVRHDLTHFHGLAGGHLLNAENDLVIGGAGSFLEQFPNTSEHRALVLRGAAGADECRE